MAYNGSPNLQSSTIPSSASSNDGSSYPINSPTGQPTDNTQYIVNDPNVAYAIGPDGNPDLNNPIYVADDGTPVVPMADNPPIIMTPAPPPPQTFWTKEVFIAIFGIVIVLIGGILLGVANSTAKSCVKNCENQYLLNYDFYSSDLDYYDCLSKCQSQYNAMRGSGIALLVIGAIVLLGDGAFKYISLQQVQQSMQQPQMQQMQMQT
ncbi:6736_t:CDS:1 [Paraglomus occultum]|uniref:6736_t:CDS:1 n=1 Tax=Paraglomus occultum TaxID=144539 RepID=A0A9N8W8D8_9GLOM|nr:6736_t:CDS:1 [Paraglomus occultum]